MRLKCALGRADRPAVGTVQLDPICVTAFVCTAQGAAVLQQLGALGSTVLADRANGSTVAGASGAGTAIQAEIDRLLALCGPTLRGPLEDATQTMRDFLKSLPASPAS